MKTIFRFLGLGVLMTTFVAVTTNVGYSQDTTATPDPRCADVDGQTAVYTKFTGIYNKKTVAEMETALTTGKEFLEKYGACESLKEQIDFVKPHVARLETDIPVEKKRLELAPLFARFDAGIGKEGGIFAKNADEVYVSGKEILIRQPDNINIIVPLAVVGLYESYRNNNKYADDSIKYAHLVLSQLKAGKDASRKNKAGVPVYGVLKYEFPKEDLINELTYAIGHLSFYAKNEKKVALPYFYELSQSASRYRDDPRVYAAIGSYFGTEVLRLNGEVAKLIAAQKAAPTDEAKFQMEPQIKSTIALLNGHAERALDAYSRAYKVAKNDTPANKTYRDELYKNLTVLYKGRFDKVDGLDTYIASLVMKPMPNPTSEVTPVTDPEPATTTTTALPATDKPATTTPTKPASATTTKVSATGSEVVTKPSETTTALKTKTAAKKPLARKRTKH